MSLNMHGTQCGLLQHNKIIQNVEINWLCSKMSKCNIIVGPVALTTTVTHIED